MVASVYRRPVSALSPPYVRPVSTLVDLSGLPDLAHIATELSTNWQFDAALV